MSKDRNSRILVIPDMHHPYAHPDCVPFLTQLKKNYSPTRVIFLGDEVDKHALSFHDSDPDLPSAGDELRLQIAALKPIYSLFPEADILESNHGALLYRKAKAHGIPRKYLRDYREVLDAPKGWVWHPHMKVKAGRHEIFFTHGIAKDVRKVVNRFGMCVVQGHFHSEFNIQYSGNMQRDNWGMIPGCLINDKAMAFAYNKLHLERPILGAGLILDGEPHLIKMHLNDKGRWRR